MVTPIEKRNLMLFRVEEETVLHITNDLLLIFNFSATALIDLNKLKNKKRISEYA